MALKHENNVVYGQIRETVIVLVIINIRSIIIVIIYVSYRPSGTTRKIWFQMKLLKVH